MMHFSAPPPVQTYINIEEFFKWFLKKRKKVKGQARGDHIQHRSEVSQQGSRGQRKKEAAGVCFGGVGEGELPPQVSGGVQTGSLRSGHPLLAMARKLCQGGGPFHYSGICTGIDGFQNQYDVGKKRKFQKVGMVGTQRYQGSPVCTAWSLGSRQGWASARLLEALPLPLRLDFLV